MNTLQKRILAAAAIVVAAGVAAYWYWSPYLVVRELRDAAMAADAGRFNAHVDFPKLRESLKGQLSARIDRGIGAEGPANAFGGMLAHVLADKMIDAAVRPETIMFAMREGKFKIERSGEPDEERQETTHGKSVWRTERQGVDTVLFHVEDADGAGKDKMALVMQRTGFADWKLTDIRLPE